MLFKEDNGTIKEKNYIWLEYRCPNEVLKDSEFCIECCTKEKPGYKYQAVPKFDHGIVGGPYSEKSKLYGSNYYLGLIKAGWKIRPDHESRAKEEQQKANMVKAKLDESGNTLSVKTSSPKVPTPKVATPKVATPKPAIPKLKVPTPKSSSNDSPKKPAKIRIAKKAPPLASEEPAIFVESLEAPIPVSQVITVKVKKIRSGGTEYYYDAKSGKLYGVSTKGVGAYKGRYDAENDLVNTSYPDSDYE
jgi:hypothetical protein